MPTPPLNEIVKPQRVKLSDDDYSQIDPADAVAWAEPNQLWMSDSLILTFSPSETEGLWTFRANVVLPDDQATAAKFLQEAMHAFWRAERPDFIATDIEDHPLIVRVMKDAGFRPYGVLPLPDGVRVLMGWRLEQ